MNITRKIFLWTFIGLLSLGQLQRIEFSGNLSGINIYFHDIFILFWLIGFIFTNLNQIKKSVKHVTSKKNFKNKLSEFKLELSFFGLAGTASALNLIQYHDFISVLYITRILAYVLFAISLRRLVLRGQIKTEALRFKFFGAGAIILVLGFLQLLFVKDTRFLAILGWDDHFHRLISTIFDPGFTGIILLISYMYFLSLKEFIKSKIINIFISLSFFGGIALTFSRATYLALIVSLLGLEIIKKLLPSKKLKFNFKNATLGIAAFIIMVLIIPKPGGEGVDLSRTSTIIERQSVFQQQLLKLKPQTLLVGNGLFSKQNSFVNSTQIDKEQVIIPSHSRIPDNLFINILLSTGVVGTILASIILLKWFVKIAKTDQILGIVILATLVHSQFNNTLLQPFVLLFLLGGIASLKTKAKA